MAANRLFDLVVDRWRHFIAIVGAGSGATIFAVLAGNDSIAGSSSMGLIWIVVGAILIGALALAPGLFANRRISAAAGAAGGGAIGVLLMLILNDTLRPQLDLLGLTLFVAAAALAWLALSALTKRMTAKSLLWLLALGWACGAWMTSDIGGGSLNSVAMAIIVPTALAGAALGAGKSLNRPDRDIIQRRTRVIAFMGPAMLFVVGGLIIPLTRTIYLSFFDERGSELVGLENYQAILTNSRSVDLSGWTGIFTSRLFYIAIALAAVGIIIGMWRARSRGGVLAATGGSVSPIVAAIFIFSFAVFASLRGTVLNNLWWVLVVTGVSTSLGLAAAVLADRARFESMAKTLIFLPMAISFVGAGIIWRFMYIARPPQKPQTGTLNAIWVGLGKLVPGTVGQAIVVVVLAVVAAGLAGLCLFGIRQRRSALAIGAALSSLPLLWLIYRLFGPGLGGVQEGPLGGDIAQPILFVQESPFNNIWLMIVLIWIQTGFAMVILSAAIKAVPTELIEAAHVDGATERQVFFRVTLPTIRPTVIVIVTALIVLVMKVFDIVRVMTNGNFGTQVIANEMWQRAFTESNLGLGSALAVVLFLGVVPAMALNVRRLQKQDA